MAENKQKIDRYWNRNKGIIVLFLILWFISTFVMAWYAEELSEIKAFGWPLSFYMASQGSLIVYLIILFGYTRWMEKLDKTYGFHEGDR